ncbi:uncharacterized protein Dere_GG26399 [Drosophila erecta]|uniref:Uncharacterized protein n=1 Tax=Drosophila erecta TaxID=7220 RepID=A0A0Q5VWT9_DROER|nr:uncharacterized protein Dere_GG26399 [Drosophila erecta]
MDWGLGWGLGMVLELELEFRPRSAERCEPLLRFSSSTSLKCSEVSTWSLTIAKWCAVGSWWCGAAVQRKNATVTATTCLALQFEQHWVLSSAWAEEREGTIMRQTQRTQHSEMSKQNGFQQQKAEISRRTK